MGTSISMKWSKEDSTLQAWRETQPEKDSDLIRVALYALMEKRSGTNGEAPSNPGNIPPDAIAALLTEIRGIREAVRLGVRDGIAEMPLASVWRNEQQEPDLIEVDKIKLDDIMDGLGSWGN